jgi:hypothetical protein
MQFRVIGASGQMTSKTTLRKPNSGWRIAAYALVWLGFCLRVFQLNQVAVEKAEMMSILWFIRPGLASVFTSNKDLNNHPLNSLLAYLTSSGNESVFTLRWHSVVIGVISVAVVLRLAREWFGRRDALLAGLLIGVSAYHVGLSQVSRGYVGLVGFTSLGMFFAWRALQTGRKQYWIGFALASILNIYSHLYGVMAVAVVSLIILALLLKQIMPQRLLKRMFLRRVLPLVLSMAAALLVSLALYLPMKADILSMVGQDNQFRESDLRKAQGYAGLEEIGRPFQEAIRPFSLAQDPTRLLLDIPSLHYGPFDNLAALAEGPVGFYLALGSLLLGLVFSWPQYRQRVLIIVAWLGLPFLVQGVGGIVMPGAYFRGRFLGFIYPAYLLAVTRGWPGMADWLVVHVGIRRVYRAIARSLGWLGLSVIIMLNLAWLGAFYSAAINEDWNEVAHGILQVIQPADVIVCGQQPKTPCNFDLTIRTRRDVQEFDQLVFETLQGNRAYVEQTGRVWMVMPHLTPQQVSDLRDEVEPAHYWLAGNPDYGQVGWILMDSHQTLGDNLAGALQLGAELSLDPQEEYRNVLSLAEVRLTQGRLGAAEEALARASGLVRVTDGGDPRYDMVAEQLRYAREAAQVAGSVPPGAVRLRLSFGGFARLVAYEVDRLTASPGDSVNVTLYWEPLAHIARNLVSYVHVMDRRGNLVAEASAVPAAGRFPTTSWQPGQLVTDTYTLTISPTIQAPLVASVEAGLFDPQKYQFIKATDEAGRPASSAIATMRIVPAALSSPSPAYPLDANFGGVISLLGYDLVSDPPGVVFYWQAKAPIKEEYTVFVHVLNGAGQLAGQMDGQPLQGNYPTWSWSPGEVVIDRRSLPALAPGSYRLLVGWYRLAEGTRLTLGDGSGDSVTLSTIVNIQ